MKFYSDFTSQYVQDICDALNEVGVVMDKNTNKPFTPDNFDTLTQLLQGYVVRSLDYFIYLEEKGLVNRGRCPYTGQPVDENSPSWTFMGNRAVYVSREGFTIMKKEDNEEYERIMGHPRPPKNNASTDGGCYIATVCYGNEFAPEVKILKEYRDEVLSQTFWGKTFIKIYYFLSPPVAKWLQNETRLNNFIRKNILNKVVAKLKKNR